MMYHLILWLNILFIPVIFADSSSSEQSLSKTTVAKGSQKDIYQRTNFTLVSEGGSLTPDKTSLTLPKEFEILSNLDEELGTKKEKPVSRRNGVGLPTMDNTTTPHNLVDLPSKGSTPEAIKNGTSASNATKNSTEIVTKTSPIQLSNTKGNNATNTTNTVAQNSSQIYDSNKQKIIKQNVTLEVNKTETHKPLVLSYEGLSNAYDKSQSTIPAVKASSKTMMNDQIPSPNKDRVPIGTNKHPGMIMPVVITILVVPMFAVLGFMALRRGREAWKNRHYKRMDFLLDGMYND